MTWLDDLTLESIIVSTTDGMSYRGLKSSVYDDCLVLRDARLLQADGISSPLAGEYVIPREKVAAIQLLPAGS